MKEKLLSLFLFFTFPFIFSQTIKGKIVFNNYTIPNVEVINSNSKTLTVSDANGRFSIAAKMNDILVFVAKDYEFKRIVINPSILKDKDLNIELVLKAEELKEVVITKMPSIKLSSDANYEQEILDQYGLEKSTYAPKVIGVNMGTIENGIDFMRIGGMIAGLFKKEKEPKKQTAPMKEFKDLASERLDKRFYLENLKLKEDEIALFLDFCDADPKAKETTKNFNVLGLMDFLLEKNIAFKKLASEKNNLK